MSHSFFSLNPDRVAPLGLELTRTKMLGDFKRWPGIASHIDASHKAVATLMDYLGQLHADKSGMSHEEKASVSYKAAVQAGKVLRAARQRIEQEAKDLGAEVDAESAAWFRSKLPDTATRLRAMEMFERYVTRGELENVSALVADPELAAVFATTNRRLIHPQLTQTFHDSLTRGALKQFQPEIVAKAEKAAELEGLAQGYTEAVRIVEYGVSSKAAAEAFESKPTPPTMPEPIAA